MKYPLIVDGSSLYARAFFACKGVEAAASAFRSLQCLLRHDRMVQSPTHLLVCWEGTTKREKNRGPKPEGFHEGRVELIRRIEESYGDANCLPEEGEADEAVAAAAYKIKRSGHRGVVASGDKDLEQLCCDEVDYFSLILKRTLSQQDICKKWGVTHPSMVALALAVIGDSVDEIKGIPGYGPKKAENLFRVLTSGMTLLDAYDSVRESLSAENKAHLDSSLALTMLFGDTDVPDPVPVDIVSDFLYD